MTPFLIAITGGSGSGKSTLAKEFRKQCGEDVCAVIGEDNYYKAREDHEQDVVGASLEDVEKIINFDDCASKDMDAMVEDIKKLKRGETVFQPVYVFEQHDRAKGESVRVDPKPIIIIEGIHVLSSPDYADLFDLTVFVDTPADLRLARRISRDTAPLNKGGRGRDLKRVIAQYLKFVRASHQRLTEPAKFYCDLVIADEGLPAYLETDAQPSQFAKDRMVAPLANRVRTLRPDFFTS